MMHARHSSRATMLTPIFLVAGAALKTPLRKAVVLAAVLGLSMLSYPLHAAPARPSNVPLRHYSR